MNFTLEEIHSGLDDDCLWVTLGFVSAKKPLDVLHIVCATVITDEDRRTGMADLYLERADESEACYGGVRTLVVTMGQVALELSAEAQQDLRLPASVRFLLPSGLPGAAAAVETLTQMAALEPGRCIRVAT